ncbi:MAG: hypothetical protein KKE17_14770 [Proteobacteria bacterium]|nr:hypothetical protein [Pseudomonadota bacterium]MBU1711262.1 hypothetical protein [Pseudomonadota bacterium]
MKLVELCMKLNEHKVSYAIVGGHAVALHGAIRGTVDFDFIIKWTKANLLRAERALNDLGLVPRQPITAEDLFSYKDEYERNKNLKAWNFVNLKNPLEQVDLVIIWDLAGMKAETIKIQGISIRILSIDDLIRTKEGTGRQQDIEDVKALTRISHQNLLKNG